MVAILNFCIIILETLKERAIPTKVLAQQICAKASAYFSKKLFAHIFGSPLEFLHKMQKCIYLGSCAIQSNFGQNFVSEGLYKGICPFVSKNHSQPVLAAIINFSVKHRSTHSSGHFVFAFSESKIPI